MTVQALQIRRLLAVVRRGPVVLALMLISLASFAGAAHASTVATPTFSPAAGTYTSTQTVTISDSTSGATIYYTTNGSTPTTSSTQYTSPITVSSTETVKAIGTKSGYTQSAVGSAAYTITPPAATPTFSPGAGTYNSAQTVTISDATSGSTIYYTTNGTTPTTSSTKYTSAISVSASETVEAIATASGHSQSAVGSAVYTLQAATPTFSPGGGTYNSAQTVTISDSTSGTTIYYTTNGTTPTTSSTRYTGAITLSSSETVEAIATATGYSQSAVGSAVYTLQVATPTFSPVAGTYTSTQTVTISDSTSGTTIYYTTNGSTPTTSSTQYTTAITVSSTETVKAIATKTGYSQSGIGSAAYTINFPAATPTFSIPTGTYNSAQTVTISDTTSGSSIYYTTNGITPTTSSTLYTGSITVSATERLEAIAIASGYSSSAVAGATYTIVPPGTVGTLNVYISPPDAQSTTVSGALTETFDAETAGTYTTPYASPAGIGTYTGSSSDPIGIDAPNVYGGATDSEYSTPTNYFAVGVESGSENPVYLALAQPAAYFGFWWSAGDAYNRVALYSGSTLYGTFSTADLLNFLNNGSGTITAANGTQYEASTYFGNPNITSGSNDSGEPFAYVSFVITNATIDTIAFYNLSDSTGFESDNHSVVFAANTVNIPTTYVPVESLTLGSQAATPVFSPVGGNYSGPQTVTISTTTAGASINYTTNGTTPSATVGTPYTGPVTVSQTETVQAIAYETGITSSPVTSATYTIPVEVSVSPATSTLYAGQTQQFTATVTNNSNTAVTWSLSPSSVGSINASGLYTAPVTISTQQTLTITATSQASSSATATATITLYPPIAVSSSPTAVSLYAGQTQQFSATVANTSNTGVTWSISPSGVGSINSSGLYTAPTTVSTQQTVTVTATSQASSSATSTATVTLYPPIAVTVAPTTATITGGQTEQFAATVTNASNTAVTWSISPSGTGTISSSGLYTAPSTISSQQTVIITATSQANSAISGSATVTLSTVVCTTNGYGYERSIVIDHTKVPNTDQADFPMLVSGAYPFLATVANGGAVQNSNGYDIIFTSDAAGQNPLNFEIDNYNAATGTAAFWIRIPLLSHASDTVIYMWYGNAGITASQETKSDVWKNNYLSVYHLGNGSSVGLGDSSPTGYSLQSAGSPSATGGVIGGGAAFSGDPGSYLYNDSIAAYPTGDSPVTLEAWVQMAPNFSGTDFFGYGSNSANGSRIAISGGPATSISVEFENESFGGPIPGDNNWHHVVGVYGGGALNSTSDQLYVDGAAVATTNGGQTPAITNTEFKIGGIPTVAFCCALSGSVDEVRVSSGMRSADWVATEYNNESSPSTFYTMNSEIGQPAALPATVNLYGGQFQQFTAAGLCTSQPAVWSMPAGSPGTLNSSGLYSAPAAIDTSQTVTISGSTFGTSGQSFTATVNLLPPVSVSVTPNTSVLTEGQSQQFAATVNNAETNSVVWSVSPLGAGSISPSGLYTAPSTISARQTVVITAASQTSGSTTASATITLMPPASLGVSPALASLYSGQSQQFTASVTNTVNPAVTWSVSPTGVGTVSSAGVYTAPASVTAQQDITITATSQADPGLSASSTITLLPIQCGSGPVNGYTYGRTIIINHSQVPNTDQTSFPVLISGTYPYLATTANGGRLQNSNGYDIQFTSDAAGQNVLPYEADTYNPVTGQAAYWVLLPTLSHTTDTTLYMWYGNANVTSSQQNKTAVWANGYAGVWHFGSDTTLSTSDSTSNANNGTNLGVTAGTGLIGGAGVFNGSGNSYIDVPSNASFKPPTITLEGWVQMTQPGYFPQIFSLDYSANGTWYSNIPDQSYALGYYIGAMDPDFQVTAGSFQDDWIIYNAEPTGQWVYLAGTYDGNTMAEYVNGVQIRAGQQSGAINYGTSKDLAIGTASPYVSFGTIDGLIDEARISTVARSADWIATEFNNDSSPASFYSISSENGFVVNPGNVLLYESQSQQFTVGSGCNASMTWSMPTGSPGTLTGGGLYTSPSTVSSLQTITLTATSTANPSASATATVTLEPLPVSVSVTPATATMTPNQTQQFSATVTNAGDPSVVWSVTPFGVGAITASGLYSAPSTISAQLTVTITATSNADPDQAATATITLTPSQCASSGFGYQRVIVIDHTKVPNTDQANFSFLFNTADSAFANIANGGKVTSPNGYDIMFSTDPNGATRLDEELEQYNPTTGQVVAWIRIPTLSHSADTVLYMFYGNPNITASQQNPTGVWDSNYTGVYHLGNVTGGTATDSTLNANNGADTAVSPATGEIDGAGSFGGAGSYIQIPQADFPSFPVGAYNDIGLSQDNQSPQYNATVGVWFKTATSGGLMVRVPSLYCTNFFFECVQYGPIQPGDYDPGGWNGMLYIDDNGKVNVEGGTIVSTQSYNDNNWHFAVVTYAANGTDNLYVDGQNAGSAQGQTPLGYSAAYAYFVGTSYTLLDPAGNWDWLYFDGDLDEVTVSSVARSSDWVQTEYNNQGSPSTFYRLYSPTTVTVTPSAISLYASQTQQFAVTATCDNTVAWSMTSGAPGTLTSGGLYTAPASVSSQQAVTVTATSQSTDSSLGSAVVTLLPPPTPLVIAAATQPPYTVGTTQSFEATLQDADGSPEPGIVVNFTVNGANGSIGSATTNGSGIASYTYAGANSGTDTIQANAVVNGVPETSNSLTANWVIPGANPDGNLVLLGPNALGQGGLVGAFTDNTGAVIEPLAIGAASREFIVPAGATQLQLGINDTYFPDNGGSGYVVAVTGNPNPVSVPATTMPWNWVTGGLNNNYQYGLNDGTAPVVATTGLTAGQTITVAYESGTVSTDSPLTIATNANGDQTAITGVTELDGAYFPTLYTTPVQYPAGQPITFDAVVTSASGTAIANAPVELTITGANPGQLQGTTDSTGTATFLYSGTYSGTDTLQAQATIAANETLMSSQAGVAWITYPTPPASLGSLSLVMFAVENNLQAYTVLAKDASGNPIANANVGLYVYGIDNFQQTAVTDATGHTSFSYYHTDAGTYNVVAVTSVGRNVVFSNVINGNWTPPTVGNSGGSNSISVSVSGLVEVALPNTLQLTGSVSDNVGITPTVQWSQVSGPGTATFATPQQDVTTIAFSDPGTYVLQLSATDTGVTGSAQFTVKVDPIPINASDQGEIGSPLNGSTVTGLVPIVLAPNVTLTSGTLVYFPANNINAVTTLNANVSGSGQIATLDTTMLSNQSYWIEMQATDVNNNSQYSLILVTASGNYKPGRVTANVTDLVVPVNGLSISIQRQYDSLSASTSSDFGYGWSLSTNVNLTVDPKNNVTFTLGGQRRTFYFTPQAPPCTIVGCLFPWYSAAFTAEPGFYGTLTDYNSNCALDYLVQDGSTWDCQSGGPYSPQGYVYTDATGTSYLISANGNLQSITDKNGNALNITASGITSSTGLNVPFVRDSSGRITQITDPQGNNYLYTYDENGNLATVTYPNTSQPSTYTYAANHYYTGGTDFRSNPLPTTAYYGSEDLDPNGLPLNGRLASTTDALNETTSYAYNLNTNTTTVTYPQDSTGARGTATMVYDSYGDLLSSTDPLNHTTVNVYDLNHDLLATTDPLGHVTSYTYDQNGNKTSVTYPATGTSTNTTSTTLYNQYSEPTSTTDQLGNVRNFNYDANYNPQSVTDGLGTLASFQFNPNATMAAGAIGFDITQQPQKGSQFTYDANGNLASRTDALGRTTSYTYNSLGQKLTMTIPVPNSSTSLSAATTTYSYDPLGDLTQTAAPLGRTTSATYDGNGNKLTSTDARGNVTSYTYDALNRLVTTTYPTNPVTTSTNSYDFRNNVIDSVDQDGHDTHNTYDLAGRLISVTKAYGTSSAATTTYTYDNAGRKLTQTDPLGHETSYSYDNAGNMLSISGPQSNFQYTYDNARNKISMTDGLGHTTRYQYDARNRLTVTTYPDQTATTNAYDGPGNLAGVTDQAGNQVQYTYDGANQLKTVVQLNSPNTGSNTNTYGYDNDGNLITLSDENGHTTQNAFDLAYEEVSKTLPDASSTETRTYDNNGNLATVTHFNGVTTTYTWDQLNRMLTRSTPGETTVSHTYTATGKYQTTTDASGTTNYTYDSMDRLITKATPEGTLTYTYDGDGHVLTITSSNANGASVSYTYDSLNRLSTVTDNRLGGAQNVTTYTYDTANNLLTETLPNNLQSTFQYDPENRLSSMTAGQSGFLYNLGPTGIRTGATESTGRTVGWSFDGIYRLTGETVTNDPSGDNGSVSYSLDPVGNRLSQTSSLHNVPTVGFSYGPDDTLLGETYDNNGNVTATGGKTYSYDSQNELISANGGAVTTVYDGFGNRVSKTANGVTTKYLVDDLNPTGYPQVFDELTGSSVTRTYTYGLQRISENQVIDNVWTPSFYGYDGFGTVRQLTNSAGAVTDTFEYDAFGNAITHTGTTPNNYLYRGEQYDPDLGLYYLRARYDNSETGRFASRDPEDGNPASPATLHRYLYADGNPVDGLDPTGRNAIADFLLISGRLSFNKYVVAGVVATGLAITCELVWDHTKFSAAAEAAPTGGYITQVAPCYWSAVKGKTTIPPPPPLPLPVPGTPPNPWPSRCPALKAAKDTACELANSLGGCTSGMSTWQLEARYAAWVACGEARAQYDKVCWNGGDEGHQKQEAQVWIVVANCSQLLAGSQ
jgi:RHS repeat-associated protein